MKQLILIAIALVIPVFFLFLVASSAYHRRKNRAKKTDPTDPADTKH